MMQLCLHNRKSQGLILNKDSFIKFLLMAASVKDLLCRDGTGRWWSRFWAGRWGWTSRPL